MKFVVDVMLGKLAKWLRILGYDTIYKNTYHDNELLDIVRTQGRFLLTRDTHLAQRAGEKDCVLIESQHLREQVKQITQKLGLDTTNNVFTICTICNRKVQDIPKSQVEGKVPAYIYQSHEEFVQCPECGRIYWVGTHYQGVQKWLTQLTEK